jgi:hypothetical protein
MTHFPYSSKSCKLSVGAGLFTILFSWIVKEIKIPDFQNFTPRLICSRVKKGEGQRVKNVTLYLSLYRFNNKQILEGLGFRV